MAKFCKVSAKRFELANMCPHICSGQGIQPTNQQLPEKADLRQAAAAAAEARAAQSAQPARSASSKGFIQR